MTAFLLASLPLTRNLGPSQHEDVSECILREFPNRSAPKNRLSRKHNQALQYTWVTQNRRLKNTKNLLADFRTCIDLPGKTDQDFHSFSFTKQDSEFLNRVSHARELQVQSQKEKA